jgi:hypothetical protein
MRDGTTTIKSTAFRRPIISSTNGGAAARKASRKRRQRRGLQDAVGAGLRHHWGVENNLHWQLDVNFGEDRSRVQKRNAAENLALLRRLTLSLLKAHPAKESIARKRYAAALDPDFLEEILRGDGIMEKQ